MPAAGESDASVPCCGMNGWQSRWPWPRVCTTAHSARGRARAREVEEQDKHEALRRPKAPPPGKRPGVLKDPELQGRMGQNCGVGYELVQALDVPVLQIVEQHVEVLSFPPQFVACGSRAGYRSAHPVSSCTCCSACGSPRTEDGGTVGGSADDFVHFGAERRHSSSASSWWSSSLRFFFSTGFSCVWWSTTC